MICMPNLFIGNNLAALTLDLQWTRMEAMRKFCMQRLGVAGSTV